MSDGMTIGRLAGTAGVNVETIRYYQRLGLIEEPRRPPGGQRRYPALVVAQIGFVRRAQQLGFTLAEVKELLRLAQSPNRRDIRKIAQKRYSSLTLQAAQIGKMRRALKRLLEESRRKERGGVDPIIAALRGDVADDQ